MKRDISSLLTLAAISVSLILFSAACSQTTVTAPDAADTAEIASVDGQDAAAQADGGEAPVVEAGIGPEESLDSQATAAGSQAYDEGRTSPGMLPVYFDFDQSLVRIDQKQRLEMNATFLNANPNISIRIEGNCDERGTNEYNVALGERRAMSAKNYLQDLGVAASRMETISYGEEQPINHGHDELSWSQNRRDDFAITQ